MPVLLFCLLGLAFLVALPVGIAVAGAIVVAVAVGVVCSLVAIPLLMALVAQVDLLRIRSKHGLTNDEAEQFARLLPQIGADLVSGAHDKRIAKRKAKDQALAVVLGEREAAGQPDPPPRALQDRSEPGTVSPGEPDPLPELPTYELVRLQALGPTVPSIQRAGPLGGYRLGPYDATLLGAIESEGPLKYRWGLAIDEGSATRLFIAAETASVHGQVVLTLADGRQKTNLGADHDWTSVAAFLDEGLRIAAETLGIKTPPQPVWGVPVIAAAAAGEEPMISLPNLLDQDPAFAAALQKIPLEEVDLAPALREKLEYAGFRSIYDILGNKRGIRTASGCSQDESDEIAAACSIAMGDLPSEAYGRWRSRGFPGAESEASGELRSLPRQDVHQRRDS